MGQTVEWNEKLDAFAVFPSSTLSLSAKKSIGKDHLMKYLLNLKPMFPSLSVVSIMHNR